MNILLPMLLVAAASQPRLPLALPPADQAKLAQVVANTSARLAPSAKLKLHNVAIALRRSSITDGTSRAAVVSAFPGASLGQNDIRALQLVALKELADTFANDLTATTAKLQVMGQERETLQRSLALRAPANAAAARRQLSELDGLIASNGEILKNEQQQDRTTLQVISILLRVLEDTNKSTIQNLR